MDVHAVEPCCKQWLEKNHAPTVCLECDTEFVVTENGEAWPLHLLDPHAKVKKMLEGADAEQD